MRIPDEVANAAKKADLDAVKAWLAQQTANIDKHRDKYGWTLLHLSCLDELTADHIALAEYLLSCGANIDRCGKAHNGPVLHLACALHFRPESADMVGFLLRQGSDVNSKDTLHGATPLTKAIRHFYQTSDYWSSGTNIRALDCVVKLLRAGASLDDVGQLDISDPTSNRIEAFLVDQVGTFPSLSSDEHFVACQAIIAGVRAAGSWRAFRDAPTNPWRAYERVPRKAVLRLRSLVARGRATTANPVFKALFASPNEIVWHVLSFWDARIE